MKIFEQIIGRIGLKMLLDDLSTLQKKETAVKYFQRFLEIPNGTFAEKFFSQTTEQVSNIVIRLPKSYKDFLSLFGISAPNGWEFLGNAMHPQINIDNRNKLIQQDKLIKSEPTITYFAVAEGYPTGFRWVKDTPEPEIVTSDYTGTYYTDKDFWTFLLNIEIDTYQNSKDDPAFDFSNFVDKTNDIEIQLFE